MHSNLSQWKHIPTDINPAYIPTRLPKISDLADNSLWWNGPSFLSNSMISWPKPFVQPAEVDDEAKNEFKRLFIGNIEVVQLGLLDPCRYSVGKVWNGFDQLVSLASILTYRHIIVDQYTKLKFAFFFAFGQLPKQFVVIITFTHLLKST